MRGQITTECMIMNKNKALFNSALMRVIPLDQIPVMADEEGMEDGQ